MTHSHTVRIHKDSNPLTHSRHRQEQVPIHTVSCTQEQWPIRTQSVYTKTKTHSHTISIHKDKDPLTYSRHTQGQWPTHTQSAYTRTTDPLIHTDTVSIHKEMTHSRTVKLKFTATVRTTSPIIHPLAVSIRKSNDPLMHSQNKTQSHSHNHKSTDPLINTQNEIHSPIFTTTRTTSLTILSRSQNESQSHSHNHKSNDPLTHSHNETQRHSHNHNPMILSRTVKMKLWATVTTKAPMRSYSQSLGSSPSSSFKHSRASLMEHGSSASHAEL